MYERHIQPWLRRICQSLIISLGKVSSKEERFNEIDCFLHGYSSSSRRTT